ncbi:MAG: PAS domain S-box protein [Thermotogota bacterium]
MSKLIPTSMRLPEELMNHYQELSEKLNIPRTMLMRDGLSDYIKKAKSYENNGIEYAFGTVNKESIDIFEIHDSFKEFFAVYEWNNNAPGKLVKINSYGENLFEKGRKPLKELLEIENEIYYEKILNDLKDNQVITVNREIKTDSKEEKWFEFNLFLYISDKFQFLIVKGIYLNEKIKNSFINEKININNILRKQSDIIYVLLDDNYRIIENSEYFNNISGYEEKELFMKSFDDFILQNKSNLIDKASLNLDLITKNGDNKKLKTNISVFHSNNNKRFLVHGWDITEKKHLEFLIEKQNEEIKNLINENVEETVQTYQSIIDKIPYAIFYKDTKGKFLGCNKKFEVILGVKNENIVGKDFDKILDTENYKKMKEKENLISQENSKEEFSLSLTDDFGNKKPSHIFLENWTENTKDLGLIGIISLQEEKNTVKNILDSYRNTNQYFLKNVIELKNEYITLKDIFYTNIEKRFRKKILIDTNLDLKDLHVDVVFLTALNIFFENIIDFKKEIFIQIFIENTYLNLNINYKENNFEFKKLFKLYIEDLLKQKNIEMIWEEDNIFLKYKMPDERLKKIPIKESIDYSGKKIILAMENMNILLLKNLLKTKAFIATVNSMEELVLQLNSFEYDKIIIKEKLYKNNEYLLKKFENKITIVSNDYLDTNHKYVLYPIVISSLFEG